MTEKEFATYLRYLRGPALREIRGRVGDHAEDVFQEAAASFLPDEFVKYPDFPNASFLSVFRKRLHDRMVNYVQEREKGAWKYQCPLRAEQELGLQEGVDVGYEKLDDLKNIPFCKLTTFQLEALDLYYGHGMTQTEIAEALGIGQQRVNERLHRALFILNRPYSVGWEKTLTVVEQRRYAVQAVLVEALAREGRTPKEMILALVRSLAAARRPAPIDPSAPAGEEASPDPQTGEQ